MNKLNPELESEPPNKKKPPGYVKEQVKRWDTVLVDGKEVVVERIQDFENASLLESTSQLEDISDDTSLVANLSLEVINEGQVIEVDPLYEEIFNEKDIIKASESEEEKAQEDMYHYVPETDSYECKTKENKNVQPRALADDATVSYGNKDGNDYEYYRKKDDKDLDKDGGSDEEDDKKEDDKKVVGKKEEASFSSRFKLLLKFL